MDFARQQRDPTRHLIGITFVVLVHALVIYVLLTGLGTKAIQIIKKPLTATIIEEVKLPPPPPPPPPKKIVEPPKAQPEPAPFIPPPEIPNLPPPITAPVIAAPTTVVPTAPHVIAPPPPVVEAPPPPPPPKPAVRRGIARISGDNPEYPRAALKAGIEKGYVLARVMIDEKGNVTDVVIVKAEPPRYFDRAVIDALKDWKFRPEGEKYVGEVEINFKVAE
jgi:protein TonB